MSLKWRKRRKHPLARYVYIPIVFIIAGYGLLYIAGKPVFDMASSVAGMVFTKSSVKASEDMDSIYHSDSIREIDFVKNSSIETPEYETCYATITCDKVGLSADLYFGDSDKVFKKGAGQYMGSFLPGNNKPILIGGHDSTFFAPLEQIAVGDVVEITTNYGIYDYKITDIQIKDASDATAYNLEEDKEELILYTCYPFGTVMGIKKQRYFVYGDKITGPEIVQE